MQRIRGRMTLLAAAAALAAGAGVGYAAIPDSQTAVISGCYEKKTGILRVLDAQGGKSCGFWETPITWNQRGPAGPIGPQGLAGAKGDKGDPGAPAPLYSAGSGLELAGTEFRLAFDPATQAELDAEASARTAYAAALQAQVAQLQGQNEAQANQIATLQASLNALQAQLTQLTGAISVTGARVTVNRSLHVEGSTTNPRTTIP